MLLIFLQCGTTVTQQILHLLLNEGEQPDQNMMEGIPWLEKAVSSGELSTKDICVGHARFFKSHASPHLFPGDWRKPKFGFQYPLSLLSKQPILFFLIYYDYYLL